jgi:hypothetical protein
LLNKGEISYNLNSRVLNYSLGMPRLNVDAQSDGSE